MRRRWAAGGGRALVLAVVAAAAVVQGASGQQAGAQETRADSLELRMRQRLQALGRPPGALPDSVRIRLDSLRADSILQAGERQGAGGLPVAAGDSTLATLMEAFADYDVTSYAAKRADYDARREELFLYGDSTHKAELGQPSGDQVEADSLIHFDQRSDRAEAVGAPVYAPANGDPVDSRRLVFDTRTRVGSAYDARTKYSQGGTTWNVSGDLPFVNADAVYGDHTDFTSCDLAVPHYHFETNELKIVAGHVLVARPVKLYFADVPVAWLPFIFQSLSRGRASGILAPRFSVNDIVRTASGYHRRVSNLGFYWAINDYMDATVALDWFSGNYTAVTGNLRYAWLRKFLNGSTSFRRYWRAEGGTELSFDTQQRWQMSERTDFNVSAQYATSTSFVRQNSFDPREVTSQIRSQGGLSHRFDWGSLSLSADRSQSLSDDRVDMNLPRVTLSLRPVTLLSAPTSTASWYNNMTWNGSANFSRRIATQPTPESGFTLSSADQANMNGSASSSFTVGRFSVGQQVTVRQQTYRDVPFYALDSIPGLRLIVDPIPGDQPDHPATAQELADMPLVPTGAGLTDISQTDLDWSTSISYQQPLIGTTTLTPNISLAGSARRSDTVDVAQSFVSSPTRISFGAGLKADFYGFYPGVGGFQAIRHKLSPSFSYDWAPEVQPTALQERVFGSTTLQRRSALSVTLNQTWEGKRVPAEEEAPPDSLGAPAADSTAAEQGGVSGVGATAAGPAGGPGAPGGPRQLEQGQIVNILSIQTSAVRYDFVSADKGGDFLSGFQTMSLNNTISSDYLRGLNINMTHDLFEDTPVEGGGTKRRFSPHLSRLNFGFTLDPSSTLVKWLGLGGGGGEASAQQGTQPQQTPVDEALSDPFGTSVTDESSIIPGRSDDRTVQQARRNGPAWRGSFNYALTRPRGGGSGVSQILNMNLNLQPTPDWQMTWSTALDLERGTFNDHRIRLTRDLHRWQANFDFFRTATGNWTFRFEVSLLDNQDLHFDYQQRSGLERPGLPSSFR